MRKLGKLEDAAKVVALCLPPVVMSLIGLAALSGKKVTRWLLPVGSPRLLGLPRDQLTRDEAFAR